MEKISPASTSAGPAERFTGDVYVDPVVSAEAGFSVASVHFTPGAHTAWHSHAAGQVLHCTEGLGLVATADEVLILRPGDTVWTPPDVRHWHGAAPDRLLTHLAMSGLAELVDGQEPVSWQEHVDAAAYREAVSAVLPPAHR